MEKLYARYKNDDKLKIIRIVLVSLIAILLLAVGFVKIIGNIERVRDGGYFISFAWVILIVCFALLVIVGFLEIYENTDIGKLYPIIAITFGLIFVFLIPAYETPDEQDHFGNAYNISNRILNYGNPYNDDSIPESEMPFRYMRAADGAINETDLNSRIGVDAYDSIFNNLNVIDEAGNEKVVVFNHMASAGKAMYYLPALGITLARVLNLGFGFAYIFGAILNMLFYVLMTTYAINKIPIGKRIIFVISLLPITMQQASSYSYDCGVMACMMVVIAQSFFLKYGDTSTRRDWAWNKEIPVIRTTITELLMYILCALLLVSVKSGVFLVVYLLPIALCNNKSWFCGKAKIVSISVISVILVVSVAFVVFIGYDMFIEFLYTVPQNVRKVTGVSGAAPIEYITNPDKTLSMFYVTFKANMRHYIAQLGGTSLGYVRIFVFKGVYIANLLMLLISMVRYNTEEDEFKLGNRIVAFIIGILPIVVTVLAMLLYWTLPTDEGIAGIQARYFIPTLPILMMSVGRWKKLRIPNIDNLFVIGMTITGYTTCISVLSYI